MRPGAWIPAACAFALVALAGPASASGSLSFLNGSSITITAGAPFSWMRPGLDMGPSDGFQVFMGHNYSVPTQSVPIYITTSSDDDALDFVFVIRDRTREQAATGFLGPDRELQQGERIIIVLDPNGSSRGGANHLLETGATALQKDYRFEVVIKNDAVSATESGYFTPRADGLAWNGTTTRTAFPSGYAPTASVAGGEYNVHVRIPFSLFGVPPAAFPSEFGVAFAILNDLGHGHTDAGATLWDMTGTAFPASNGLNYLSDPLVSGDPALLNGPQRSGDWADPGVWAVGYLQTAPVTDEVHFSHSPRSWLSQDIRLANCKVPDWDGVVGPMPGEDQSTLRGWYAYDFASGSGNRPCRMKVFAHAYKVSATAGAVKKRFVVVWARPGIAPSEWYLATVSSPIPITHTGQTFDFIWPVEGESYSSHPCLRIYAVPESFPTNYFGVPPSGTTLVPVTDTRLRQMEAAYGFNTGDIHADLKFAQMNFTNLTGIATCALPACAAAEAPGTSVAGFLPPFSSLFAQAGGRDGESPNRGEGGNTGKDGKPENTIRVYLDAVGLDTVGIERDHTYILNLGGMGWQLPVGMFQQAGGFTVHVETPSPAAFFPHARPDQLRSVGAVFFAAGFGPAPGTALPKADLKLEKGKEGKPDSVKLVLTAAPSGNPSTDPPPSTCGYLWWLIILLILLILILLVVLFLMSRKRPASMTAQR